MKNVILTLLFSVIWIVQVRGQETEREESFSEQKENKSALMQMITDRNYPLQGESQFGKYLTEMLAYRNGAPQTLVANWNYVDASGNLYGDVGRTTHIAIDTVNSGTFYVSTTNSGVWKTTDNGVTYTPITESLPTQSTSCLLIDHTNPGTMYLATGTHNIDIPRNSLGVYKTTDGGITWNATGLSFLPTQQIFIGDLIQHPQNNATILAATSDGLYQTTDGGVTWIKILNTYVTSVRYKPGNPNVIYAAGTSYFRSDDGGASFIQITSSIYSGWSIIHGFYLRTVNYDSSIVYLGCMGLLPPSYIPVLYIYQSTDSGLNFSIIDSVNVQYCQQFDAAHNTPDKLVAGFYNVCLKQGASGFTQVSTWNGGTLPYMHTDQRGIYFDPLNDSIIYFCNDGGLYRTTDNCATFQNITGNMQLAHLYGLAQSTEPGKKILVAPLDVPPYIIGNAGIDETFPMVYEAFSAHMSPLNDSIFMFSHNTPFFTINSGNTFYNSTHFLIGNAGYKQKNLQFGDCFENESWFASYNNIFKSSDNGLNYAGTLQTTYNPYNSFIAHPTCIKICRNSEYVYACYTDSVYVTTNNGAFTNITAGLPAGQAVMTYITTDPVDEKRAWVACSGYSAGNKVFFTDNAGQTWTNVSTGLPNIPVNVLVTQKGIPGAIYAGTDGGVFYKDDTFSSWQFYGNNLPAVMITGIDINYPDSKIRVSTYGRGVWESDLYQPTPANYLLPPVAMFSATSIHACLNETINFNHNSCGVVDSVLWLFPGGTPVASTAASPTVSYSMNGNYTVTLIAYNGGGTDTLIRTNLVQIDPAMPLPYYEPIANLNAFVLPAGAYTTDVNNDGVSWNRGFGWTDGSSGPDDDWIYYDNFFVDLNGAEERFIFPAFDLSGAIAPKFYFYRSYQQRDQVNMDTLNIYVKPCGGNEVLLFSKGGSQLANIGGYNSQNYWVPNQPGHWLRDSVDLSAFTGQTVVIILGNKGDMGQLLYIDEFRVESSSTGLDEVNSPDFKVFPNPTHNTLHIRSHTQSSTVVYITDMAGRELIRTQLQNGDVSVDVSELQDGVYFVKLDGVVRRVVKM